VDGWIDGGMGGCKLGRINGWIGGLTDEWTVLTDRRLGKWTIE